jgi:hypothetical protein
VLIVDVLPFKNFIDLMQGLLHHDFEFAGQEKMGREPFLDLLALI